MRSGFLRLLLTLALAAAFVAAESELAHAMEIVYYYTKYQTEFEVYGEKADWIAPDCARGRNVRCTFSEFVSYIKLGDRVRGPKLTEIGDKFNWQDRNEVRRMVTKMVELKDPTDRFGKKLYMSGNVAAGRVVPKQELNGKPQTPSLGGLYRKIQEFDKLVTDDIARMPDGDAKNRARAMHDISSTKILPAATQLRKATRDVLIYQKLIAKFSPTGKFDKVYEYPGPDGKTLRFDPIQWVADEVTLWDRKYKQYNEDKTAEKSPQLRDPVLYKRVTDHIRLWENDGGNGRGEGLLNYDPTRSGTNKSHANVINLQETTYARFRGVPLPRCN